MEDEERDQEPQIYWDVISTTLQPYTLKDFKRLENEMLIKLENGYGKEKTASKTNLQKM